MDNITYIALSNQSAMQRQLDVIANNLANLGTSSYKGERVMFEQYMVRPTPKEQYSFVQDVGVLRDYRAGEMKPTGNPFDLAINGKGFLTVDTPQGVRYTRNGRLQADNDGNLSTMEGYPVLDDRGLPIRIDMAEGAPSIASDGTVSSGTAIDGKLALVIFDNEQKLSLSSDGLYETTQTPKPATEAKFAQGMLESSNIQPIVELTTMMQLTRSYQAVQNLIQAHNDERTKAIDRLAKI